MAIGEIYIFHPRALKNVAHYYQSNTKIPKGEIQKDPLLPQFGPFSSPQHPIRNCDRSGRKSSLSVLFLLSLSNCVEEQERLVLLQEFLVRQSYNA